MSEPVKHAIRFESIAHKLVLVEFGCFDFELVLDDFWDSKSCSFWE